MSLGKRSYSTTTIKLLFGLCGNECAHPDCANPIIQLGSAQSDAAIVGQISHIYAASSMGPRGNPALTEKQRNAPENLILLCGHHHPIVDRQFESFPAELLRSWKKEHEEKIALRSSATLRIHRAPSLSSVPLEVLAGRDLELFGVSPLLELLRLRIEDPAAGTILSIEGLGGLGKTALASHVLADVVNRNLLDGVAWYSVRNAEENAKRRSKMGSLREEIIGNISAQLSIADIARSASRNRTREFLRALSEGKFVVVIDNIEVGSEFDDIAELITQAALAKPSKFILTSRVSLPVTSFGGFAIQMRELSGDYSLELMRAHARARGLLRISEAKDETLRKLFAVVGGNPQALRLCVGLSQYYPIDRVTELLSLGKGDGADELYRWIYLEAWKLLSKFARELLITMRHVPSVGADWQRLLGASGLAEKNLAQAIKELSDAYLLQIYGTADDPLYSVHRLTATFVQHILEGWMSDPTLKFWVAVDKDIVKRNVEHTLARLEDIDRRRDG